MMKKVVVTSLAILPILLGSSSDDADKLPLPKRRLTDTQKLRNIAAPQLSLVMQADE